MKNFPVMFSQGDATRVIDSNDVGAALLGVMQEWKEKDREREKRFVPKREELKKEYEEYVSKGEKRTYTNWVTDRLLCLLETFKAVNDHRFEMVDKFYASEAFIIANKCGASGALEQGIDCHKCDYIQCSRREN